MSSSNPDPSWPPPANPSEAATQVPRPARAAPGILAAANSLWLRGTERVCRFTDRFVPTGRFQDQEHLRRGRLIARFGFLGAGFGLLYALFYAVIGHGWGVAIILICSPCFAAAPWLMRRTGSLALAGHLLSLVLTVGFTALCLVEGGVNGHAVAWLASVPMCALLLVGRAQAGWWVLICFGSGAAVVMAQFLGWEMHPAYDMAWHQLVSAAGFLGLIVFLFLLGAIFETGRERAFGKLRDARDALAVSNTELTRLNEEKNEFLGIAAHDLKNPLTVVIGTAELLPVAGPERVPALSNQIVGAGQRMLHLIKNLLDANAIEEGRFTSNRECFNLAVLARESRDHNQPAAARKEIVLQLEDGVDCWADADRNATMQILDNLISNAVKYSPRGTRVSIRVEPDEGGGRVQVAVEDQGPGLSEEDQGKLFRKFTRLSARPTGGESSTGLGLAIVKRLAEAMSGTVRCQSTLGAGAIFTLGLPAGRPERARLPQARAA